MIPLIILLAILMAIVVLTVFSLARDLCDRGCLAWHRDSIGFLVQAMVSLVCLLVTCVNLKNYIEEVEETSIDYLVARDKHVMSCFLPMMILAILWLIKIFCFKVKNAVMHLSIAISIFSIAFAFESHFDTEYLENAPLFVVAIPLTLILLAISF